MRYRKVHPSRVYIYAGERQKDIWDGNKLSSYLKAGSWKLNAPVNIYVHE